MSNYSSDERPALERCDCGLPLAHPGPHRLAYLSTGGNLPRDFWVDVQGFGKVATRVFEASSPREAEQKAREWYGIEVRAR